MVADLVNEINLWYKNEKIVIILDRHFHRKIDQNQFNRLLRKSIHKSFRYKIKHVDSQQDPLVNMADMSAGAILWKYTKKDRQFYNLIRENIIVEKLVNWPEMKRKSLNKKLT